MITKTKLFNTDIKIDKKIYSKYVNPFYFFKVYSKIIKENSYFFTDTGTNLTWCMQAFQTKKNQRLISAWGNSPMGYSVAASIGASINTKKNNVYAFIGDGSLMINLQELHFIKSHKLPIKIIVLDNEVLGNTKLSTEKYFDGRTHASDLEHGYFPPDIKKLCLGFDIKYFYINNNNNLSKKIKIIEKYKTTCLVHVNISSKQETQEY